MYKGACKCDQRARVGIRWSQILVFQSSILLSVGPTAFNL